MLGKLSFQCPTGPQHNCCKEKFQWFAFVIVVSIPDECEVSWCQKHHKPSVRFPFRLQHRQPSHCGYPHPGFQLSCSENGQTLLNFPPALKLVVTHIDYKAQRIHLYDPANCLWRQFSGLNSSAFPFYSWDEPEVDAYTLFNCSSDDESLYRTSTRITCLTIPGYQIIAIEFDGYPYYAQNLLNCSNVGNFSAPIYPRLTGRFQLRWKEPNCSECEMEGKGCRLKINSTQDQTECFYIPSHHMGVGKKLMIAGKWDFLSLFN
ncbi:receptor-like protein kinase [Corchorus olitorius]|uniref:RING-type E3 ubiquitin transferase n=1 Tax=Corchorus olitorius TaxID=93759 RepID=A0A1R3KNA9_9ROSI|nr:receptor-like protein kinase [Corchorus olitorius]